MINFKRKQKVIQVTSIFFFFLYVCDKIKKDRMEGRKKGNTRHWPGRNLGELADFIDRQYPEGYTLDMLALRLGMTKQNISLMMTKDDIKLSKAEEIAAEFGHTLKLHFPQREHVYSGERKARVFPNAGNLSGLAKYLADSNISVNYMSQRVGMANNVITNAFDKGDIMISKLYAILANLRISVQWIFEKTGGDGD